MHNLRCTRCTTPGWGFPDRDLCRQIRKALHFPAFQMGLSASRALPNRVALRTGHAPAVGALLGGYAEQGMLAGISPWPSRTEYKGAVIERAGLSLTQNDSMIVPASDDLIATVAKLKVSSWTSPSADRIFSAQPWKPKGIGPYLDCYAHPTGLTRLGLRPS